MPFFEIVLQDRHTKVFHIGADEVETALDEAYTLGEEHAIEQDFDVIVESWRELDAEEAAAKGLTGPA